MSERSGQFISRGNASFGCAFHLLKFFVRHSPYAAETAVVRGETGVGVAGSFSLARGGATLTGTRFPTAATNDALYVLSGIRRTVRIDRSSFSIVGRTINILAP